MLYEFYFEIYNISVNLNKIKNKKLKFPVDATTGEIKKFKIELCGK